MAAPTVAYHNKKFTFNKTTPEDVYVARFLQNTTPTSGDDWGDGYFNSTDSDLVKKQKIKDIFKLDDFIMAKNSESGTGFIGIIDPNGDNSKYHNSLRFAKSRAYNNISYVLLNDAGLNTLGYCALLSIVSNASTSSTDSPFDFIPRINDLAGWGEFRSSYYANSELLIQMKLPSSGVYSTLVSLGFLDRKLKFIGKNDLVNNVIDRAGIYDFRAVLRNAEGDFVSDVIQAQIFRAKATLKYNSVYASSAFNGITTRLVYYDTIPIQSTQGGTGSEATSFAKNDVVDMQPSDYADYGYYIQNDKWYKFEFFEPENKPLVTAEGFATTWGWPTDDPLYRFFPEFFDNVLLQFQEATLSVTSKTLSLISGTQDSTTTPPSFPNATYDITLNCSIALNNKDLFFYIQDPNSNYYFIGSGNTGSGSTRQFQFSGSFSSLGLLPYAAEQYYILISDEEIF
jgi:hypothetical protein